MILSKYWNIKKNCFCWMKMEKEETFSIWKYTFHVCGCFELHDNDCIHVRNEHPLPASSFSTKRLFFSFLFLLFSFFLSDFCYFILHFTTHIWWSSHNSGHHTYNLYMCTFLDQRNVLMYIFESNIFSFLVLMFIRPFVHLFDCSWFVQSINTIINK